MPLHTFHAFVVVEYDFDVLASSTDEAEEMARTHWLQNRSVVNVAHIEVEIAPDAAETADDSLDTPPTDE